MEKINFDQQCLEILKNLPKKLSRNCFRSALNHLTRAEKLFNIDNPMAVFRCITAEEEAATGLIWCLIELKYQNSEHLKPRNHVHKAAVIQFFKIMNQFIEDSFRQYGIEINLLLQNEDGHIRVKLDVHMPLHTPPLQLIPEPPLNFSFLHEGKRFSYKKQIDKLVNSQGADNIKKHLTNEANKRNLLLYASNKGYQADIQVEPRFFPAYQSRVLSMLRAYLLIEPYKERQPFVQDSLDAFLAMVASLNLDDLHNEL